MKSLISTKKWPLLNKQISFHLKIGISNGIFDTLECMYIVCNWFLLVSFGSLMKSLHEITFLCELLYLLQTKMNMYNEIMQNESLSVEMCLAH